MPRPLARRDCNPATFVDPADLRSEPIEDEFELEYLVYTHLTMGSIMGHLPIVLDPIVHYGV